jgi:predicted ATPase
MNGGPRPARRTKLVEREQELYDITGALGSIRSGSGRLFVIEGPAGMGKTELLAAARDMAHDKGMTVLAARGTELEAAFPYGIVRQLFEPPVAAAPLKERAELLRAAFACSPLLLPEHSSPESPITSDPSGITLLHALWWLGVNLASRSPILITLDDAQWADPASLRFLLYLANRLESLPSLLILTVRSGEPFPPQLAELMTNPVTEILTLRPLSDKATRELVRERLSERPDEEFCKSCHDATKGNPFLLNELLITVGEKAITPDEAGAAQILELGSPSVSRSVLRRLERLGPKAIELARALALWGGRAELRQATAVAEIGEAEAGPVADELSAIEILRLGRPLEFVHPLVRAAIYSDLPTAARAQGHRRVAELLVHESFPAEHVAAHLLLTEPAGEKPVVRTLLTAATAALARGAPEGAKQYLERALREPPDTDDLGEVRFKLGVAEMRIDPKAAVEHLTAALEIASDHYGKAMIGLELIRAHLTAGTVVEAEKTIRPLITALNLSERELALRLEAELIIALRQGLAASPLADEQLDRWKGRIRGSTPAERLILSQMAVRAALTGASAEEVADLAEAALGDGLLLAEQSSESVAAYVPLYPLVCADRFEVAGSYLDKAETDARHRGSPVAFAIASTFKSHVALATGDLRLAESQSSNAVEIVSSFALKFFMTGSLEPALAALIETGELARAEEMLTRYGLDGPIVDSVPGRIFLATRGRLRLAQARTAKGLGDLFELREREREKGLPTSTSRRTARGLRWG